MQGTHLEDMVNDVCTRIFEKMEKETGPFIPNNYTNRLVIHMLYTMCFGKKYVRDVKHNLWLLLSTPSPHLRLGLAVFAVV